MTKDPTFAPFTSYLEQVRIWLRHYLFDTKMLPHEYQFVADSEKSSEEWTAKEIALAITHRRIDRYYAMQGMVHKAAPPGNEQEHEIVKGSLF